MASLKPIEDASNPNPITPHPFADIFPPMNNQEREELEKSIKKNGLRKKITIDTQNRILDGLNRYRACIAVGVRPQFELFEGTEEEARALIWDGNMVRRHHSTSVKAGVGADWTQLEQGQHKSSSGNSQITVAAAAKQLGISESSIHVGKAVKHASPELHSLVKADGISLNAAESVAKLPDKERIETIQQVRSAKSKKDAGAIAKAASSSHTKKSAPRAPVVGKIEMLDDEGRPLQNHYSKLFAVSKAVRRLPDELRGLRGFIEKDNHRFPRSGIVQLKDELTKLARTDFNELGAAIAAAIADLNQLTVLAAKVEVAQAPDATAVPEADRDPEPASS